MSNKTKSPTPSSDNLQVAKLEHEVLDEAGHHVIGNPGLPVITQNILFYLDHGSQMAFRQVCQSWREQVDQPLFWIKKLNLKSRPKKLGNVWIDLVGRIQKGSGLEKEVTECLMKWYGTHQSYKGYKESLEVMSRTRHLIVPYYVKPADPGKQLKNKRES